MREACFGYYPKPIDWALGDIQIRTLDSLADDVKGVVSDPCVEGDWIFAPDQMRCWGGAKTTMPYKSRVFGLPKTHVLTHASGGSDGHLGFLVWGLSFLVGMRLTTTEAGFLDSTPIKRGVLNDIVWLGGSLQNAFLHVERFWQRYIDAPDAHRVMASVIHAYFLSRNRNLLDYERFILLYIALDGCYRMLGLTGRGAVAQPSHGARVARLCKHFAIAVPDWAVADNSEIVKVRNNTLHEGLFFGEPIGFTVYGGFDRASGAAGQTILQMGALVCRLTMGLLGIPAPEYIASSIASRQRIGVSVPPAN